MEKVCLGIVGLGKWGHNQVRVFSGQPRADVKYIHDTSREAVDRHLEQYPFLKAARSFEEILEDPQVQALVIATPAATHYELARRALEAGKDVLVEKPMTVDVEQAERLCELSEQNGRLLQVGHLLLFHPAVQFIRQMIDAGELGDIYYLYSQRVNLGVVRNDENALLSLAPHDVSLSNFLLGASPKQVQASGGSYLQAGIEDVIFVTLTYPNGSIAHLHVSWLDPHKVRRLTIVGSRKMVVFDDMQTTEKVRLFDKGVSRLDYENFGELLSVRTGDILIPSVPNTEPLRLQAQHFLDCVSERRRPLVDGRQGLEVVRVLEAAGQQL